MVRTARLLIVCTSVALAGFARAETDAHPAGTDGETKRDASLDLSIGKRERPYSSSVAAALASTMPKYNPPPKPKPEDESVDLREVDKPKNGIIRLPRYTVQEQKPPVFRERDIYTAHGLSDLAKRRYLTPTYRLLNSVYIPFFTASPEQHAMQMYQEDERLQNIADLSDNARDVGKANPSDGVYIKRLTDQTYMRGTEGGSHSQDSR